MLTTKRTRLVFCVFLGAIVAPFFFHSTEDKSVFLIVGLGNPGDSYKFNRHNVGFLLLEFIKENFDFSEFRKGSGQSLISEGAIEGKKIILLKPQIFMNLSGGAIMPLMAFYKIKPENLLVIHDELEIEPGDVRMKKGGGHGGHNGLRSIDSAIGRDYWRLRIGIGRPSIKEMVSSYVLHNIPVNDFENIYLPLFHKLSDNFTKIWNNEKIDSTRFINDVKID